MNEPTLPIEKKALLIELGWEVCNQIGGIYTVLRSKSPEMVKEWGDAYCLVGPLNHTQADIEFEDQESGDAISLTVEAMRAEGVEVRIGRWQVSGRPRAVLIGVQSLQSKVKEQSKRLLDEQEIIIPPEDELVRDVVAFSAGVHQFLTLLEGFSKGTPVIAHFHEWMSGVALPLLKHDGWSGHSVFTTHATLIGRYIAMSSERFYSRIADFDDMVEAKKHGIMAQHMLEKASARDADKFTTVSGITALECKHLLGREVDELVPNGLNINRFLALHEFQQMHTEYKEKLHEFTMGYFFPSYNFELDQTLYFFSSGRFEFRNKGMDLTLEALSKLNQRLIDTGSRKTVVFLLITKQPVRSMSVGSLEYAAMFREFKTIARSVTEEIRKHLIEELAAGHPLDLNEMVPEVWKLRIRRAQHAWHRDWLPPIVTHDLLDDGNDEVINKLRELELFNNAHDKVKVVYHPDFVRSTNPLFSLDYEELIRGCHLGIFPSFYEPWGYTPLETLAMGVPAVSSDLAGFGVYASALRESHEKAGLYLVNQRGKPKEEAVNQLTDMLFRFCQQNRRQRIAQRNRSEAFAQNFDWTHLIHHYHEVHQQVLSQ